MKEDVIDDFVAKDPSSNSKRIRINRYIISYPFKDELLISEQRSSKTFPFITVIIFGAMGGFFAFSTGFYFIDDGFSASAASIMCLFFALIMWGIVTFLLVQHYSNKRRYTFEKNAFVYKGLLTAKKTILKEDVRSVYIKQTNTRTQGSSSVQYRFTVCLKVPELTKNKGVHELLDIEMKDSLKTVFGGTDLDINERAQVEAKHICELISEHWKIPVSI